MSQSRAGKEDCAVSTGRRCEGEAWARRTIFGDCRLADAEPHLLDRHELVHLVGVAFEEEVGVERRDAEWVDEEHDDGIAVIPYQTSMAIS